jgi:hypothetical protein
LEALNFNNGLFMSGHWISLTEMVIDKIDRQQDDKGKKEKEQRVTIRCTVMHGLHLIVNSEGRHSCLTGNIAADHQHDAEFADGMGKAKHDAGKDGYWGAAL